jgi:hypothetical protein
MGIEKLRKAATAAGFAMANSEDMLPVDPGRKTNEGSAWRPTDPRAPAGQSAGDMVTPARGGGLREWWLLLSRKATA